VGDGPEGETGLVSPVRVGWSGRCRAGLVTQGRQFKPESETDAGSLSSRSAGALWAGPGRGTCLSNPSPRYRGFPVSPPAAGVPASRPSCGGSKSEQVCGASSQGLLGLAGTWVRATGGRPARGQVPPISRGE
jgi:hypothetical protein